MATELQLNTDDEEDKLSTDLSAPAGGGPASGAPQRASTPSNKPNVQQYLQANQGAGQKLAGGIEQNIQKQAGQVERGVGETRSNLESGSQPLESKLGEQGSQFAKSSFKDPQALLVLWLLKSYCQDLPCSEPYQGPLDNCSESSRM